MKDILPDPSGGETALLKRIRVLSLCVLQVMPGFMEFVRRDPAVFDDLVNSVAMKVLGHQPVGDTYLTMTIRSYVMDHFRKRRVERRVAIRAMALCDEEDLACPFIAFPVDEAQRRRTVESVDEYFRSLPPDRGEAGRQRYYFHRSSSDIAAALSVEVGRVRHWLRSIHAELLVILEPLQ